MHRILSILLTGYIGFLSLSARMHARSIDKTVPEEKADYLCWLPGLLVLARWRYFVMRSANATDATHGREKNDGVDLALVVQPQHHHVQLQLPRPAT